MQQRVGRATTKSQSTGNRQQRQHGTPPADVPLGADVIQLWDSRAEECIAAGSLLVMPHDVQQFLLAGLNAAAPKSLEWLSCNPHTCIALAQLLVLAFRDRARVQPELAQQYMDTHGMAKTARCLLQRSTVSLDPTARLAQRCLDGKVLCPTLMGAVQIPQLGAQQLAAARAQLSALECREPANHTEQLQHDAPNPVPMHAALATGQSAELHGGSNSSGILNRRAVIIAVDLCVTYLKVAQELLPFIRDQTTRAGARRCMRALIRSQLLDQAAHTLLCMAGHVCSTSRTLPFATTQQPAAAPTSRAQHGRRAASAAAAALAAALPPPGVEPRLWAGISTVAVSMDMATFLALSMGNNCPAPHAAAGAGAQGAACAESVAGIQQFLGLNYCAVPEVVCLLGAPGVQYYAAARMVQALCAVDGGPRWGMPLLPLPSPDTWVLPGKPSPEERVMAIASIAGPVLAAGLCAQQLAQSAARRQPGAQPDQPQQQVPQQREGAGAPQDAVVRPGGAFRIATRSLEWALQVPPAQADPGPSAPPLPRRMCMSSCDVVVVDRMLPLAVVALRVGAPGKAAGRLRELLPLAVAVLGSVCDEDAQPPDDDQGVHSMVRLVLKVLLLAPRGSHDDPQWSDAGVAACMPAALDGGLLPALQAAAAWLTPERIAIDVCQGPGSSVSLLLRFIANGLPVWPLLAAPPPALQVAALVASVRSTARGALVRLLGERDVSKAAACKEAVCNLAESLGTSLVRLLLGPSGKGWAAFPAALAPAAALALVQWGPCVVDGVVATIAMQVAQGGAMRCPAGMWLMALLPIAVAAKACELLAAAEPGVVSGAADNGSSGGPDAGAGSRPAEVLPTSGGISRAARLASWRRFLLCDLRALDRLGQLLQVAAGVVGMRNRDVALMLAALQAVARALPADMQRHLEAAQAQRHKLDAAAACETAGRYVGAAPAGGCKPVAQGAGGGLAWLPLDPSSVQPLAEGRFDAVELPGLLKGRNNSTQAGVVLGAELFRAASAAAQLPAPCEVAALLPTCDNPGCTAHARYLAAGRGTPLPALCACPKCGQARYCSKGCRKVHLEVYHKAECGQEWWKGEVAAA